MSFQRAPLGRLSNRTTPVTGKDAFGSKSANTPEKKAKARSTSASSNGNKYRYPSPHRLPPRSQSHEAGASTGSGRLTAVSTCSLSSADKQESKCSSKDEDVDVGSKEEKQHTENVVVEPPATSDSRQPSIVEDVREKEHGKRVAKGAASRKCGVVTNTSIVERQTRRALETQFVTKRRRYSLLKKELQEKQKAVLEVYTALKDLRDRLLSSGSKDVTPIEEAKLVDFVASAPPAKDAGVVAAPADAKVAGPRQRQGSGENLGGYAGLKMEYSGNPVELLKCLEERLQHIPDLFVQLCQEAISKRNTTLNMLAQLLNGEHFEVEFQRQMDNYQEEGELMERMLESARKEHCTTTSEVLGILSMVLDTVEKAPAGLCVGGLADKEKVREVALVNQELQAQVGKLQAEMALQQAEVTNMHSNLQEMQMYLQKANEELILEQSRSQELADKLAEEEDMLENTRNQLKEVKANLINKETLIQEMTNQMKEVEEHLQMKNTVLDSQVRDMNDVTKTSSDLIIKLERERETFKSRIEELSEQILQQEQEATVVITDLRGQLAAAQNQVVHEKGLCNALRKDTEDMCAQNQKLKDANEALERLVKDIQQVEERKRSQREDELWTELQSTKVLLQASKGQIANLEEEKGRLMDTVKRTTKVEEEERQRIYADVLEKDKVIKALHSEVKELEAKLAINNEQMMKYEEQLTEMKVCGSAPSAGDDQMARQVHGLQQKVAELQSTVSEVVCTNEHLEQVVQQKEVQMEQRERVMREQGKVLKVRDELIALLKAKDLRQEEQLQALQESLHRRGITTDKVSKEVAAKADELQGLYQSLETKQLQVLRLEKLVKQLEEQQERSQAQRTRHEARIAQLELALQAHDTPVRGRKFPFL